MIWGGGVVLLWYFYLEGVEGVVKDIFIGIIILEIGIC